MSEHPSSDSAHGSVFSPASSDPPSEPYLPSADEATPTKRKRGAATGSGKTKTTASGSGSSPKKGRGETWTAERCTELMELIIDEAKKGDLEGMTKKLGVTRKSLVDQLSPNRKKFRSAALRAIFQAKGGK